MTDPTQAQTSPCLGGILCPTVSPSELSSAETKPELLLLQDPYRSLTAVEQQPWNEWERIQCFF